MDKQNYCEERITDRKKIRFCVHFYGKKCTNCEETFERKVLPKTTTITFHQFKKDITCFVTENSNEMIVDIGCPNSVIGSKDVSNFKSNLSEIQQKNLKTERVDENFKFGPSGPYNCLEKLRFPIQLGQKVLWGQISIVNANIPM